MAAAVVPTFAGRGDGRLCALSPIALKAQNLAVFVAARPAVGHGQNVIELKLSRIADRVRRNEPAGALQAESLEVLAKHALAELAMGPVVPTAGGGSVVVRLVVAPAMDLTAIPAGVRREQATTVKTTAKDAAHI